MPKTEYDYYEILTGSGRVLRTCRVCRHSRVEPVESSMTGEVLARLCLDCDAQLPAHG